MAYPEGLLTVWLASHADVFVIVPFVAVPRALLR
jgi:hypothetical protein